LSSQIIADITVSLYGCQNISYPAVSTSILKQIRMIKWCWCLV